MGGTSAPAGWYWDPEHADMLRYWDGRSWTDRRVSPPYLDRSADRASPAASASESLVVERTRVYGHDMLYVRTVDGTTIGRVNLGTGRTVLQDPARGDAFDRAVREWRARHPDVGGQVGSAGVTTWTTDLDAELARLVQPPAEPDAAAWVDLAPNTPGAGPRAQARAHRDAAPARAFLARLFDLHTEERAWRVGAQGEEAVGRRLRGLGPSWRVLHGVPVGTSGSDIDHVVIGPGGVFTLNTKHHPRGRVWVADRTIMVNGTKVHYLRNARFEAERASRSLTAACGFDVQVEPVIVPIARDLTIKAQPTGVHVVGHRQVVHWLTTRPVVLSSEAVETVFERARRDTTWRGR